MVSAPGSYWRGQGSSGQVQRAMVIDDKAEATVKRPRTGPPPIGRCRGLLVKAADEMEQQLAAGLGKRQVAELGQHDEVHAAEVVRHPALPAGAALRLEPVH